MEALLVIFLCGDLMLGRGVDQIMAASVDPELHESYVKDARRYVRLAERRSGPIPQPVDAAYIWGDALPVLQQQAPALRLVNLETSITTRNEPWPHKGIHYRMHPDNVAILAAAKIDGAILANNHVLDWGYNGLLDTLRTLRAADVKAVGAGINETQATNPVAFETGTGRRVMVYAYGSATSGVFPKWAADEKQPGVAYLPTLSPLMADAVAEHIRATSKPDDVVIFSIHWGGNWGYEIPDAQRAFAHHLIDKAGVDLVYGHSSHHAKGIEHYRQRLILYGCGDFLNDYEGIGGHEKYRPDLALMYFPAFNARGDIAALRLVPMQIRRMQLATAPKEDVRWLRDMLNRESKNLGVQFEATTQGDIVARFQ